MLLFFYFESGNDVLIWVILAAVIFAVAALITKAAFVIRNNKKYKENKKVKKNRNPFCLKNTVLGKMCLRKSSN